MAQRDQDAARDDDDEQQRARQVGSQTWRRRNKRGHGQQDSLRVDRRFERVDFVTTAIGSSTRAVVSADCHRDRARTSADAIRRTVALSREALGTISPSGIGPRTSRRPEPARKAKCSASDRSSDTPRAPRCSLPPPSPARRRPCRIDDRLVREHRHRRRVRDQLRHLHDHRRQRIDRDAARRRSRSRSARSRSRSGRTATAAR